MLLTLGAILKRIVFSQIKFLHFYNKSCRISVLEVMMSVERNSLRVARERSGMTRAEAARRAGMPYQALVRLETSALPPMVERVLRVCDVVGADVREVVGVVSDH